MTGDAHNLAALEQQLLAPGWSVRADGFVTPDPVPGWVDHGGYRVDLTGPDGEVSRGEADTRADAFRQAADRAGQLPEHLRLQ